MSGQAWNEVELAKLPQVFGATWRKVDLVAHFPGRTWSSIVQKARQLGLRKRERWTIGEEVLLASIYVEGTQADILARLPGRQWPAIVRRACELGLKRDKRKTRSKFPIVEELRRIRRSRGIELDALATKFGAYGSGLSNWESGSRTPTLPVLLRWADALNLELTLQPKGIAANTAKPIVDQLGKARLMARDAHQKRRAA